MIYVVADWVVWIRMASFLELQKLKNATTEALDEVPVLLNQDAPGYASVLAWATISSLMRASMFSSFGKTDKEFT